MKSGSLTPKTEKAHVRFEKAKDLEQLIVKFDRIRGDAGPFGKGKRGICSLWRLHYGGDFTSP